MSQAVSSTVVHMHIQRGCAQGAPVPQHVDLNSKLAIPVVTKTSYFLEDKAEFEDKQCS